MATQQPHLHLWVKDSIAELNTLSLAERGAWITLRLLCAQSSRRGIVELTGEELARAFGSSGQAVLDMRARLGEHGKSLYTFQDLPDGRVRATCQAILDDDKRRKTYATNGRIGGKVTSVLLKQKLKQMPDQSVGIGIGIVSPGNGGAGGKGLNGADDALDEQIRQHFAASPSLLWSPVDHEAYRKLVLCCDWDTALECVNVAISARASRPIQYALSVLGSRQRDQLKKPKISPPGKWADKPYAGG